MGSAVELYEKLASAPDEKTRARLIAEAFERMEERYPEITDLATRTQLSETELRLQKEIVQIRADMHEMDARIHEMDGRLTKEIEQVRAELKTDIEQVRAELKTDIAQAKVETIKWTGGFLLIQLALLGALIQLIVG
jgi:DNA repair exonuclease SbcCD ATPase subunit